MLDRCDFESVSVAIPQREGAQRIPNIHVLGFSLVRGCEIDITQLPPLPDPLPDEVMTRYIRTADRILRVDPDGRTWRLKLGSFEEHQPIGYLLWADPIRLNRRAELTLGINDGRPIGEALVANILSGYRLLQPVEQVLYRTDRVIPGDWVSRPTDTVLRFDTPRDFSR